MGTYRIKEEKYVSGKSKFFPQGYFEDKIKQFKQYQSAFVNKKRRENPSFLTNLLINPSQIF